MNWILKAGLVPVFLWAGVAQAEWIAAVEHGTDSVILEMELYTADGTGCLNDSDLTGNTGLQIEVSSDGAGVIDTYTVAASDLENITTIGTYETPTTNKVRVEQIASGSCVYEMHLANAVFDTTDATVLKIAFSGDSTMLPVVHTVDLSPVSSANLIAEFLDTSCTSYATDDDVGYQLCTVNDDIQTDTSTTLDNKLDTITTNTGRIVVFGGSETIDTVTSQTVLVDSDGDVPLNDDAHIGDFFCVRDEGATPEDVQCSVITDYAQSTGTFTIKSGGIKFTIAVNDTYWIERGGANIESTNDVPLKGIGTSGNPWAPDD